MRINVDAEDNTGGHAGGQAISANGQFVSFLSEGVALVPGVPGEVYVRDLRKRTAEVVDVNLDGRKNGGSGAYTDVSANGRYVTFESEGNELVAHDTNGASDVFVRDRIAKSTLLVSLTSSGKLANGESGGAAISLDGRYIAYWSTASNLVRGDTNGELDIFRGGPIRLIPYLLGAGHLSGSINRSG